MKNSFEYVSSFRASLEDRLKLEEHSGTSNMADTAVGSKQLTFTLKKVNSNSLNQGCKLSRIGLETHHTSNLSRKKSYQIISLANLWCLGSGLLVFMTVVSYNDLRWVLSLNPREDKKLGSIKWFHVVPTPWKHKDSCMVSKDTILYPCFEQNSHFLC